MRVTVWYPAASGAAERDITVGPPGRPLFSIGSAAANAAFAQGGFPVILLSHGFGGTARIMGWFGIALARAGNIVVAVDHPGNNAVDDMTKPGALLIWERPDDLRAALDAVSHDAQIAPHLDVHRLGAAGFSAGGFTALAAGGAAVDMAHFLAFCAAQPDDGVCRPQQEFPVSAAERAAFLAAPEMRAEVARSMDDHSVPGVRAVFLMAPALVQALHPSSLAAMRVPVKIMLGDADKVAPPATNGAAAARAIPRAVLVLLPGVGHYDFLANCTPAGLSVIPVCPTEIPRTATHDAAIAAAVGFFSKAFAPAK